MLTNITRRKERGGRRRAGLGGGRKRGGIVKKKKEKKEKKEKEEEKKRRRRRSKGRVNEICGEIIGLAGILSYPGAAGMSVLPSRTGVRRLCLPLLTTMNIHFSLNGRPALGNQVPFGRRLIHTYYRFSLLLFFFSSSFFFFFSLFFFLSLPLYVFSPSFIYTLAWSVSVRDFVFGISVLPAPSASFSQVLFDRKVMCNVEWFDD